MTRPTPDPTALRRKTYTLTFEDYKPGDPMVQASLTVPERPAPAKFFGEPEVLEVLAGALEPANVVDQVLTYVQWAASALDARGKISEAEAVRRIVTWLQGNSSDPVGEISEPLVCHVCGRIDAREHSTCGLRWCVLHWHAVDHTCIANRKRSEVPPPLVPIPAEVPTPSYQ